jgi:uncharacterized membrane protein YiaA
MSTKPSPAFIAASWVALGIGVLCYNIGLFTAKNMQLNEKGYYFTILMFGLFSAVSLQKAVRDKMENIPVTPLYFGIAWVATILSLLLLVIGLWNADIPFSERGFYGIAFVLSIFGAIAVQKNTRDMKTSNQTSIQIKNTNTTL